MSIKEELMVKPYPQPTLLYHLPKLLKASIRMASSADQAIASEFYQGQVVYNTISLVLLCLFLNRRQVYAYAIFAGTGELV